MPSGQHGSVVKFGASWGVRFYDEAGGRRRQAGFRTKTEAREWLDRKLAEVAALRRGDRFVPTRERPQTVDALLDGFLERHGPKVDAATARKLRAQLKHARATFGDRHPDGLHRVELEDWREGLPAGSRHDVFRAFRQALAWAVERDLASRNGSNGIRNPKRKRHERREVHPFESWQDVFVVADELDPRYRALPIVAVGCGLRPEELFGLDRRDVDRQAGLLHVRRRYTGGVLKEGGKTDGSVRAVPLRRLVLEALDAVPTRLDTPVLFAAPRGGRIDLEKWRYREWAPAVRAAGLEHRRVYDCRHTFATWAIESGVHSWYPATIMGTSVAQLEDTYARWLKRTDDQLRAAFDAYDAATG
ncbi:MAG: tyrosine-type recombinase/integrase [Actinobacteria bacterium]|nr:tyrosine-type recombinase/integrase [Actinomycetota bacterium]